MRAPLPVPDLTDQSWVQQAGRPRIAVTIELLAMMEAAATALPELDSPWHEAVARPERRPRNGLAAEPLFGVFHVLLEDITRRQRLTLSRCPGANLTLAWT
jgi:hypothetical protein